MGAIGDLRDEQRTALQPQADRVAAAVQEARDATSLSELQAAWGTFQDEFGGLVTAIGEDLDCSQ